MRTKRQLRETQIEAIETYLLLKIAGQNKPLWELFSEGFFTVQGTDLSKVNINEQAREILEKNVAARALYEFASQKVNGKEQLPDLKKLIVDNPESFDYEKAIKAIFYGVNYPDYLFSLPMGAGKTFLMAAFIYLDLYFAYNEPDNKSFAHNFLVLVPSGLKSSIMPSLKTIENFNPSWVLPEPAASEIKSTLKFEVLDRAKSGEKSNKARNPNAQKVNQYLAQPDLSGLVLVVNAEKVILDRIDLIKVGNTYKVVFHEYETEDERDKYANELRNLIGKIPNLEIFIDEVHHAATYDIKLRQVVHKWHSRGNVTTVLGFSGTPYLSKADKISIGEDVNIKFSQSTNTTYYYPLITGIRSFLKKPTVKIAENLEPLEIIERGLTEFYEIYGKMEYSNGCIPKIAIYCGKIERLETEVYPFVVQLIKKFGDTDTNVLKYHRGNKEFKLPKENELEYNSLDRSFSRRRVILLVQVGKEGWDCRSLTGIILAQKGDSPRNMVLQTSCRCLRQVEKGKEETALIWLNEYNAKTLNAQLKEEQHTSIEEINKVGKEKEPELVVRFPRTEKLDLYAVELYQMNIDYHTLTIEEEPNTGKKLNTLLNNLDNYKSSAVVRTKKNFKEDVEGGTTVLDTAGHEAAVYDHWLADISKQSFNYVSIPDLKSYNNPLKKVFQTITYTSNGHTVYNERYELHAVNSRVRLAFSAKRSLQIKKETVKQNVELLLIDKLGPAKKNDKLYPKEAEVQQILDYDKTDKSLAEVEKVLQKEYENMRKKLEEQGLGNMVQPPPTLSLAVKSKDRTFHYIPYNFWQSGFERDILKEVLMLEDFTNRQLEIYYNGERGLTGFVITCFAKTCPEYKRRNGNGWKPIGKYTPDFLIVKRKEKELHKILIIETKGSVYANDPVFNKKKKYISSEFLKLNHYCPVISPINSIG
ncbi:MAG: DEAD/DEAH box helicase family protein [Candidatus Marinimicrobia bacterium]|nr:DEAD/DEAH box helicase family protein [Candidatus Neomarinimicrobiota bacterium]